MQGGVLPDNQAYLNRCLTVTAFKSGKYLKDVKTMTHRIRINCNAGAVTTNRKGTYARLHVWHLPKGIANIYLMHKLEKKYCITYDSWDGYYVVHMPQGDVWFYKDEQSLPYINLEELEQDAAMLLVEEHGATSKVVKAKGAILIQTVQGKYKGYTK
jgi:hypothetical protein